MKRAGWAGLTALLVTASWTAGIAVPLYDGIGFPDEPYRYVTAPAGAKHGPPAKPAQADAAASAGSNTAELTLQTDEQGPQLLVQLPPGVTTLPPSARTVTITATPLAPDAQPADGTIDGNVYRISLISDAGAASFGKDVGQSLLYLRAASNIPAPPVMEYRPTPQAAWAALKTGRGGADVAVISFKGTGDYTLVHQRGATPANNGPSQEELFLLILGGLVVFTVLAVGLVRRGANNSPDSDGPA